MKSKILIAFLLFALFQTKLLTGQSAIQNDDNEYYRFSDLRNNAKVSEFGSSEIYGLEEVAAGKKSPGLALLYSLILPGAGHWYLDRMDVGKYFLTADAISWTGLIALNIHGDNVINDAESYSVEHADVTDPDGKDEDFFANVGNYNNVYEYNNDKLSRGEYNLIYDVNSRFWNWDTEGNRDIFESQRKKSERIYNNRIIFGSLLIANRVVSGISAFLIANKGPKGSSYSLVPKILHTDDLRIDGFELSLITKF